MVTPVSVSPDTYLVDTHEMGIPERTAAYVVDDDRPTIVDTGLSTGAAQVRGALDKIGIEPSDVEYIALTHIHMDHAGAAGELAEVCENATILVHEFGVDFISDPEMVEKLVESVHRAVGALADDYGTMTPISRDRIESLSGGETIDIGSRSLEVIHSPGHAPHQVAYYDAENGCLFPADECGEFIDGTVLPSTPPPSFDPEAIRESLATFDELDLEALYYPHYGERTDPDVAIETYRNMVTAWIDDVDGQRERYDDRSELVDSLLEDHVYADLYDVAVARELVRMNVEGVLQYLTESNAE